MAADARTRRRPIADPVVFVVVVIVIVAVIEAPPFEIMVAILLPITGSVHGDGLN
jgi:ABC-type methionine transport system permease subunit